VNVRLRHVKQMNINWFSKKMIESRPKGRSERNYKSKDEVKP
jgi:hypothetical protein